MKQVKLWYLDPDNVEGFPDLHTEVTVDMHDAREDLTRASLMEQLDSRGFGLAPCPVLEIEVPCLDLHPEARGGRPEQLRHMYMPRIEDWVQQMSGADHVFAFLPVFRETGAAGQAGGDGWNGRLYKDNADKHQYMGAIPGAHADLCSESSFVKLAAQGHAKLGIPPECRGGRFMVVNVWRPLQPVECWPLALCDCGSVDPSDLVTRSIPEAKNYVVNPLPAFSPRHKWSYYSAMQPSEMLVFKSWDSRPGAASQTLHCAFPDLAAGAVRRSIELRVACFWHPPSSKL